MKLANFLTKMSPRFFAGDLALKVPISRYFSKLKNGFATGHYYSAYISSGAAVTVEKSYLFLRLQQQLGKKDRYLS